MKYFVYGLIDPRTSLIRYVGKSETGLARPGQHRTPSSLRDETYKNHWLRELFALTLDYQIVILQASSIDAVCDDECWWIFYGRVSGWPLTNATDGGDGTRGRVYSQETRAKIGASSRGRVWSNESRRRAGIASSKVTPEGRARALAAMRSPESRAKMSLAGKGRPKSPEHRAKLRANLARIRRRPRARKHGPIQLKHGNHYSYYTHFCRCSKCLAYAEAKKGVGAGPRSPKHGCKNGYYLRKCRCELCVDWNRKFRDKKNAQKRALKAATP